MFVWSIEQNTIEQKEHRAKIEHRAK